ncbi:hypothetical protein HMPREF1549_02928 [Actinomyces johnsonii F0510]|uniref:Uncharacterized protein n=1 Tax=Actinomyces johnsonii F0510 TaxID=1227262 RepID=U1R828_9ACTO|nr:hypothetical protein HMPREF1549_02928 [Actinomyces johnsonii F0510]
MLPGRDPESSRPRRFSVVASGTAPAPSDHGDPSVGRLGSVGLDRRPRTGTTIARKRLHVH